VKRGVVLNGAPREVAGSQTNVILPSTSEDHQIVSRLATLVHVKDRLRMMICEHLKVGDDDEIFVKFNGSTTRSASS